MIHLLIPLVFASINVELRGPDLYLIGDGQQLVASCEIIVQYDPAQLALIGVTNDPDAPLMNFFDPLPFFLPCNFDFADGNALFVGLVEPGESFAPSADGTRIATFALVGSGPVNIPATRPCGVTVVWDGTIPNLPVTGTLTGSTIGETPEPACTPDIDGDGVVGILDLLILLGNWGTP